MMNLANYKYYTYLLMFQMPRDKLSVSNENIEEYSLWSNGAQG